MLTVVKGTQEFDSSLPFFLRDPSPAGSKAQKSTAWRKHCCSWKRSSKGRRKKRSLIAGIWMLMEGRENLPVPPGLPKGSGWTSRFGRRKVHDVFSVVQ